MRQVASLSTLFTGPSTLESHNDLLCRNTPFVAHESTLNLVQTLPHDLGLRRRHELALREGTREEPLED